MKSCRQSGTDGAITDHAGRTKTTAFAQIKTIPLLHMMTCAASSSIHSAHRCNTKRKPEGNVGLTRIFIGVKQQEATMLGLIMLRLKGVLLLIFWYWTRGILKLCAPCEVAKSLDIRGELGEDSCACLAARPWPRHVH